GHVSPAEEAQAKPIGIFVGHGADHRFGRLPQPRIDDFHAGVAKCAGDHLDATVVTIEADLGEDDADAEASSGHQSPSCYHLAAPLYRPNTSARAFMISPTVQRARAASSRIGIRFWLPAATRRTSARALGTVALSRLAFRSRKAAVCSFSKLSSTTSVSIFSPSVSSKALIPTISFRFASISRW